MPASIPRAQNGGGASIIALLILQLGALAVVLAATPFKPFELDRFFVPKELALHATALLAATLYLWRSRSIALDRVDVLLLGFGGISLISALVAHNHWLSLRAVAVTISSLAVFWCARAVASAGARRPLAAAIILATVLGAATSLAQAYGLDSDYFTLSRAPGGTFGNRNFMAHLSAIGVPLLIWYAVTARRAVAVLLCALGGAVLAAGLVLSRSRAAWLALLIVGVLLAVPMWRAAHRVPHGDAGRRLILLGALSLVGAVAALALPNRLNWKSDSPYLDSVRGVVDYNTGSGRGRILQYRNTMHMAMAHPVLGVGPGNWPVYYPRFAARDDPSLSRDAGMTANPWPSSDWMAFMAERGVAAVLILLVAAVGIITNAFQSARGSSANNPGARDPFLAIALTATILITAAVGMFDAVLLLATPALIVWGTLGALAAPGRARQEWTPSPATRRRSALCVAAVLAALTLCSVGETMAMQWFGSGNNVASVRRAAILAPGSYRIQMRLAQLTLDSRGCAAARAPATRAAAMFPSASEPRAILRRCGRG